MLKQDALDFNAGADYWAKILCSSKYRQFSIFPSPSTKPYDSRYTFSDDFIECHAAITAGFIALYAGVSGVYRESINTIPAVIGCALQDTLTLNSYSRFLGSEDAVTAFDYDMVKVFGYNTVHESFYTSFQSMQPFKTTASVTLALEMYKADSFENLPILSDALEENGCGLQSYLEYYRTVNPDYVFRSDPLIRGLLEDYLPDDSYFERIRDVTWDTLVETCRRYYRNVCAYTWVNDY